ncbi:PREDICTED: uncharacterized protein LOC105462401 isoform X3 [Wasmannia auropunctata]|uniref:uncharacterized protein LOC105462401 isoform X2 n=1 Tax=Wasmannia auropunctata TaxID=64793 RepID=UPI0005EED16B|nr:PREDICTED: uncharacterized protein LOC105462401 isoform X2 [Wasmannia auropunctata]XP_011707258.1 PREDICTED: uncharacterized protein LOC105462401 isoform X3 [Wasmannia auropunctata]
MNEIVAKFETWRELIELEKLQGVSEDVEMSIRELNGHIFQLLLQLCRTADKCDKRNHEIGKSIAKLAKLLCLLITRIPITCIIDEKFGSALFQIVQSLISFNLYEDAANICRILHKPQLGTRTRSDRLNGLDRIPILKDLCSLWELTTIRTYGMFIIETNTENYNKFKIVLFKELKMIQMAHKNYTSHVLSKINHYLCKLEKLNYKYIKYYNDFSKYILEYFSELQLHLDKDEKYITYRHILIFVYHIDSFMFDMNGIDDTTERIEDAAKIVKQLFEEFEAILAEDEECYKCFQQYQNFCKALLLPMKNLISDSAKSIQNIIHCNLNIAQQYGYTGCLKLNAFSFHKVNNFVITYWRNCAWTDKHMLKHLLDSGILPELIKFYIHLNTDEFYIDQVWIECHSRGCKNKNCNIKQDLDDFITRKIDISYLIKDFPTKTLPAEVCNLARKILEQNIKSIIYEIKKSECIRWMHNWSICCKLIYELGILSEHVYEESVHLFSFLCTCVVELEGIESIYLKNSKNLKKITSLGLHGLSVVHYNNKMYRKAMTACALNALLTCKQSDTKAFHMWMRIKENAPKEVANLTMLECLKTKDKMKSELGFSFDTSKYDLSKLILREKAAADLDDFGIFLATGISRVWNDVGEETNIATYFEITSADFSLDSSSDE